MDMIKDLYAREEGVLTRRAYIGGLAFFAAFYLIGMQSISIINNTITYFQSGLLNLLLGQGGYVSTSLINNPALLKQISKTPLLLIGINYFFFAFSMGYAFLVLLCAARIYYTVQKKRLKDLHLPLFLAIIPFAAYILARISAFSSYADFAALWWIIWAAFTFVMILLPGDSHIDHAE